MRVPRVNCWLYIFTHRGKLMVQSIIVCPTCHNEVPLTETLARPIIEAERLKLESEMRQRTTAAERREHEIRQAESDITSLRKNLDVQAADIEKTLQERLEIER